MIESIVSQYIADCKLDAQRVEQITHLGVVECLARGYDVSRENCYKSLKSVIGFLGAPVIAALDDMIKNNDFVPDKKKVHMFADKYKFIKKVPEDKIKSLIDDILADKRQTAKELTEQRYIIKCRERKQ